MDYPKFFNLVETAEETQINIDGEISSYEWWGDEFTPQKLHEQLAGKSGPVTVWINSPGGDVIAAAEIYTALRAHNGPVTVKISALAASAASIIAMAGDKILMSPAAYMMIHNPWTFTWGNAEELRGEAATLDAIADGLIATYEQRTGLSRDEIKTLLDANAGAGTWMSSREAVDKGFADGLLFEDGKDRNGAPAPENQPKETPAEAPAEAAARLRMTAREADKDDARARERFAARMALMASVE